MNTNQFRKLINLFEARNPDIEYEEVDAGKVIARLRSYKSQSYTKLAQKIGRIEALETKIKQLKAEVKNETKENIHDLFDAEDAVRTRVVETISFIYTLTKDPKETVSPKYKDILAELEQHLTPELITVLEGLKKTMITTTQKSPGLKVEPIKEDIGSFFSRLKNVIFNWTKKYDQQLVSLKKKAGFA